MSMDSPEAPVHQTSDKRDTHHHENSHACVRKRTRASTEQLSVLESTFEKNVSPNTKLRKQLAEKLQMSERSIQIWFQNRRAKVKHMQKRAQMRMEQAVIQAQLQHFHQQQYNMMPPLEIAPSMAPLPYPQYQFQQSSPSQQYHPFYSPHPFASTASVTRAQSMDAVSCHGGSMSDITTTSSIPTPGPEPYIIFVPENQQGYTTIIDDTDVPPPNYDIVDSSFTMSRRSMPPLSSLSQTTWTNTDIQPTSCKSSDECLGSHESLSELPSCQNNFPDYVHGQISPSLSSSTRFSSQCNSSSYVPPSFTDENKLNFLETSGHNPLASTKDFDENVSPLSNIAASSDTLNGNSALYTTTVSQVSPIFTLEEDATINPSNLVLDSSFSCFADIPQSRRLNAATLTVGTWHRVNLPPSDLLLCLLEIQQNSFVWVTNEGGSQFKIEIPLTHVTNIEYSTSFGVNNELTSDVHFYLSQSPLFYLGTSTEYGRQWIQCSDFTEDKQASMCLIHTLTGSPELVQDLVNLVHINDDLQNIIHFIDPQYGYDTLQSVSPANTPTLPSQHQHPTMIVPFANYYPINAYISLLN